MFSRSFVGKMLKPFEHTFINTIFSNTPCNFLPESIYNLSEDTVMTDKQDLNRKQDD